jgi:hypothetical protein
VSAFICSPLLRMSHLSAESIPLDDVPLKAYGSAALLARRVSRNIHA